VKKSNQMFKIFGSS